MGKEREAGGMKDIAIRENHLYNKTYKRGKSFVGKNLAVYVLKDYAAGRLAKANPEKKQINRLGLSVSKKLGGAVVRNRVKRIIRAAYSEHKPRLKTGFLIVIGARSASVDKKSTDLCKELEVAFRSLSMYAEQTAEK